MALNDKRLCSYYTKKKMKRRKLTSFASLPPPPLPPPLLVILKKEEEKEIPTVFAPMDTITLFTMKISDRHPQFKDSDDFTYSLLRALEASHVSVLHMDPVRLLQSSINGVYGGELSVLVKDDAKIHTLTMITDWCLVHSVACDMYEKQWFARNLSLEVYHDVKLQHPTALPLVGMPVGPYYSVEKAKTLAAGTLSFGFSHALSFWYFKSDMVTSALQEALTKLGKNGMVHSVKLVCGSLVIEDLGMGWN